MNLSMKTNRLTHIEKRLVVSKGVGRGGQWMGVWDLQMQTIIYRMDKQGPTVYHRELYLIS